MNVYRNEAMREHIAEFPPVQPEDAIFLFEAGHPRGFA
jgi:hypothetical protein